ncbi:TPR-like protein [Calocera viscosa TUFC12733]|uniref:TPR-like protein n=1 Tax=Calocera viscosa (strain TUFC12733) TaxID=1330018 RepID=A0A167FYR8_CALVF|nr:TPR-like protein [Calocera viscosa TUFC12733]
MNAGSSGSNGQRAERSALQRLISTARAVLAPRDKPENVTPQGSGSLQPSSTAGQGTSLNAMLQQWMSDKSLPLDPVRQTVKDTIWSVLGVQEELQTRNKDIQGLLAHVSWITEQVLARIQAESVPDEATKDVMDSLAKIVSDINQFLQTAPSKGAEYIGTKRAEKLAQFRQDLDTLRIQFLEVRVVYFSQQDAGINATQVASNLAFAEIPPAPSLFFGRDAQVESIIQLLLRDTTCRIPLLGAGGMGKTSVAAAVINNNRIKDKFGENIIFLSCENLTSAEGIIKALAACFGLRHAPRSLSALLSHLSAPHCVLLVLDNLETVLESADIHRVEGFLGAFAQVPGLSMMITMRGTIPPDGVVWEEQYCRPLDRLPLEAARQIWKSLARNEDSKLDELLIRLDGLPLAIRLMASQAKLSEMTPIQLLSAYQKEATRLLKNRGAGRLKSLEVSIQLSLDCRVMTEEPNALQLLSILCLLPDGVPPEVLPEMMSSAMDIIITCATALLQVGLAFREQGRVRVLSPIRDFILWKYPPTGTLLGETGNYFGRLISDYEDRPSFPKQQVEAISAEFGNLSSILIHFWKTPEISKDVESLLWVTSQMAIFSDRTSYGDCVPLLAVAKESLEAIGNRPGTGQVARNLGIMLYLQSRHEEASERLSEARMIFEEVGDPPGVAQCMRSLGDVLYHQERYEEAAEKLGDAKATFEAINQPLGAAQCTQTLGNVLIAQSRYEEGAERLKEAKVAFEAIGNHLGAAQCTQSLGNVLSHLSRHKEAAEKLQEAKAAFDINGNRIGAAQCTRSLGNLLYLQSRYEEAADMLRKAKAAFEALGDRPGMAQCAQRLGDVLSNHGRYEEAAKELSEAKAAFGTIENRLGAAQTLRSLGTLMCMQNRYDDARGYLREAKTVFEAIGDPLGTAQCTERLGHVLSSQSRYEEAAEKFREAKALYDVIRHPLGMAQGTQSLGDVLLDQGLYEDAMEELRKAKAAFEVVGDRLGQAGCTRSIGAALRRQGNFHEAAHMLNQAKEMFESIGDRRGAAHCNRWLGDVLCSEQRYEAAAERLTEANAVFESIGDRHGEAQCLKSMGDVLCAEQRNQEAEGKLQEAKASFANMGNLEDVARCDRSLAKVFSAKNRPAEAETMLVAARDIYMDIKLPKQVEECAESLAQLRHNAVGCPETAV